MGRKVRHVKADWIHPRDSEGNIAKGGYAPRNGVLMSGVEGI